MKIPVLYKYPTSPIFSKFNFHNTDTNDPIFINCEYGDPTIELQDHYSWCKAIKTDVGYIIHNDEGPALILYRTNGITECYFAIKGTINTIEDLTIDPMLKVILKLKYGDTLHLSQKYYYP
jgi:hypothetical protein